jgi:hypothetical protein
MISKLCENAVTGVRCNCVCHAILSALDTFAYAIVSGAMQKLSGGQVHDSTWYARVSEPACTDPTYCSMNIHVFYDCSDRIPNGRTFRMSTMTCTIACKKNGGCLVYCKDGFAPWRTQLHMQMCPGGHNCTMQQRPGGHDCICKTARWTLLHMQ